MSTDTVRPSAVHPRDVERPERDRPPSSSGIGRIVAGSMTAGLVAAVALVAAPFIPARAQVLTGVVFVGSTISVDIAWAIAGVTMVVIALFNFVVITEMSGTAIRLLKHYTAQRRDGKEPIFLASDMPDLENIECWTTEDISGHRQPHT